MLLNRMIILDTLMPPPVLPAQAPMNITRTRRVLESSGQRLKSTVPKPVVEIMEATAKDECLRASPAVLKSPLMFIVISPVMTATIKKNTHTSVLKASRNFLHIRKKYELKFTENSIINTVTTICIFGENPPILLL